MTSESARVTTATEARFRIPSAAAVARTIKVAALDPASERLVSRLERLSWTNVSFVKPSALDQIASADLVVMIVRAGADAHAAAPIGQVCSDRRIHTATFVVAAAGASDEALSRTLAQVRPWSLMVVVANDEDYVEDILRSFR